MFEIVEKNCPICREEATFTYLGDKQDMSCGGRFGDKWSLYKCSKCSTHFFYPLSNRADVAELYIFPKEKSKKSFWNKFLVPWSFRQFLSERPNRGGRLLDIGCSEGEFLEKCRGLGYELYGLEISKWNAEIVRRKGIDCFNGYLDEFLLHWRDKIKKSYDCITVFETLEHLTNPLEFLEQIQILLKNNGVLVLSVPYRNRAVVFKEYDDNPPGHFTRWDEISLTKILKKAGFKVKTVKIRPLSFYSLGGCIMRVLRMRFRKIPNIHLRRIVILIVSFFLTIFLFIPMRLTGKKGRNIYISARKDAATT